MSCKANNEVEDIEKQIAKEVSTIKRPRKDQRFGAFSFIEYGIDTERDHS